MKAKKQGDVQYSLVMKSESNNNKKSVKAGRVVKFRQDEEGDREEEQKILLYSIYRPYIERSLDKESNPHYVLGYN